MKTMFLAICCFMTGFPGHTQKSSNPYDAVDEYVQKLGPLDSFNVATIADTLTRNFADKDRKARAIFYWIAHNIALDAKAVRSNDNKKTDPVLVTQLRRSTPLGFALLVQEMCSMARIRCLVVDGYVKNSAEDINNRADAVNHSWNVVQLGQSPEEWYYIDAARACGFLDKKQAVFTKRFTGSYFFADKTLFNLDHFPDNSAWQLGGTGPKGMKDFYALPIIGPAAYTIGLQQPVPITGYLKTKTSAAIRFGFTYHAATPITAITLIIGEGSKQLKPEPVNFNDAGGVISFNHTFKKDDSYPVKIVADGQEVLQYFVEAVE